MTFFADYKLAQRLEAAEMMMNAAAVDVEIRMRPATHAAQLEIAGGRAFFMGPQSPITQAIGVGMGGPVSDEEFVSLEEFFRSRGAPASLEVCPLADFSLSQNLSRHGFRPIEFSNALVRNIGEAGEAPKAISVRVAQGDEITIWSRVVAEGFFGADYPGEILNLFSGMTSHSGVQSYLAFTEEEAVGGGALGVWQGVGVFFGDATPERHRGRGAQAALIHARLATAARAGCDIALAFTACGSGSQRNYERAGFRVAYTRTKWCREFASGRE